MAKIVFTIEDQTSGPNDGGVAIDMAPDSPILLTDNQGKVLIDLMTPAQKIALIVNDFIKEAFETYSANVDFVGRTDDGKFVPIEDLGNA